MLLSAHTMNFLLKLQSSEQLMVSPFHPVYFNSEVNCILQFKKPCSYQRLLWIFSWSYNLQSSWWFHLSILYILIVLYTVFCHVRIHAPINAYYEFSAEVTIFRSVNDFTFHPVYFNSEVYCILPCKNTCSYQRNQWVIGSCILWKLQSK